MKWTHTRILRGTIGALVLLGVVASTGCFYAAAGAAGAGIAAAHDDRSVGQMLDDDAISAKVKANFAGDNGINPLYIAVSTYYGVVTLSGQVPSADMAARAVKVARATSGVKNVISKLTVKSNK